jgi:hypothetical protein
MNKEDRHKYKEAAKRGNSNLILNKFILDKERYDKELKNLDNFSKNLHKPKKCLSAYMIFVKEVSDSILKQTLIIDKTKDCQGKSRNGSSYSYEKSRNRLANND